MTSVSTPNHLSTDTSVRTSWDGLHTIRPMHHLLAVGIRGQRIRKSAAWRSTTGSEHLALSVPQPGEQAAEEPAGQAVGRTRICHRREVLRTSPCSSNWPEMHLARMENVRRTAVRVVGFPSLASRRAAL